MFEDILSSEDFTRLGGKLSSKHSLVFALAGMKVDNDVKFKWNIATKTKIFETYGSQQSCWVGTCQPLDLESKDVAY